jgi:phage-related protein
MLPLSASAILEKNKIAGDSVWLVLLEVVIPNAPVIRIVRNNENITWNGQTWIAFPFELDDVQETDKGEIPSITVKASNVTREIQGYVEDANGGIGSTVSIMVVNSKHLAETTPNVRLDFSVTGVNYDAQWISFSLGGNQAISRRVPTRRYLKNWCPFAYGGIECGVAAATQATYPTCDKSLVQCRVRANSARFGGFQGIPQGGFYA